MNNDENTQGKVWSSQKEFRERKNWTPKKKAQGKEKGKEKLNTEEKSSRERKDVIEDYSWLGWRVCTVYVCMREKRGGEEWGNAHTKPCAILCLIIHKWVRPHPTQVKQLFAAARRVHFTLFWI